MKFTLVDAAVLFILLASVIVSVIRGLMREILSLVAWVASFVLALAFATTAADWLPASVEGPIWRIALGFIVVLVATRIIGAVLIWLVDKAITAAGLKLADRGLGGLFGLARGCVIVMALAVVAGLTRLPEDPAWKHAYTTPWIVLSIQTIKPALPAEMAKYIKF
ncbi:CvpA family protein [Piscinibacterium candidicorallinum]|uniref:CvpA family protein n=1 Tax=Piscinibacterium candidicorallinum TaxID=1793872 RepID=A0ABV7GYP9_9BURK